MICYLYVWERSKGGQHIDVAWSPKFDDLHSLELDFRILHDQCAFLCIRFIRFSGCTHIFTVRLVSC